MSVKTEKVYRISQDEWQTLHTVTCPTCKKSWGVTENEADAVREYEKEQEWVCEDCEPSE